MNPAKKRVLSIAVCCLAAAALIGGVIYATYRPTLTADFAQVQPASQGGAGVVYEEGNGFSSDSVILESLALKTLAFDLEAMDRLGVQEWLPIAESFFDAGGETLAVLLPVQSDGGAFSAQLLYPDTLAEIAAQGWGDSVLYVPGLSFSMEEADEELRVSRITDVQSMKDAWCELYTQVRAADGGARLAGPQWGKMEQAAQQDVMAYWLAQDCVPDVQQLAVAGSAAFDEELESFRAAESAADWDSLPLFVFYEGEGEPSGVLDLLSRMAREGAEGVFCAAGGSVGGVSADAQSPNNLWWLYRWYAEMAGEVALVQNDRSTGGLAHSDSSIDAVEVLLSGSVGNSVLKLQSLNQTVLSGADLVRVTVEYVYDTGANAIMADPVAKVVYTASVSGNSLTLTLDDLRQDAVYRITVQSTATALEAEENEQQPVRYWPSSADGRVQISDSAARFTEETEDGTGAVSFKVSVPENGSYQIELQYGYLTPSESAVPLCLLVDGEYELGLELEPSEQDGFRSSISFQLELEKGTRTITLEEADAAQAAQPVLFCLDSTFLCGQMEALPDALYEAIDAWERMTDDNNAFLLSVPEDGYYTLYLDYEFEEQNNVVYRIDGTATGVVETVSDDYHSDVVYLARGLHYIELDGDGAYDIYTVSAQPAQDPGDTEELDLSQA